MENSQRNLPDDDAVLRFDVPAPSPPGVTADSSKTPKRSPPTALKATAAGLAKAAERKQAVRDVQAIDLSDFMGRQRERMREHLAQMPAAFRNRYLRAMRGKSMRAAVTAHCCACFVWENVKQAIEECSLPECALWPYRPGA